MKRSMLSDVADELGKEESAPFGRRKPSRFTDRGNQLAGVMNDDRIEKVFLKIDPDRCRMWPYHNRRYDLLNERNCADLLDGMRAQGEQEFPAIVRRVDNDPNADFEVICGARRHWAISWLRANNFPRFKFLIEVRDLNDEEAFRLADAENRERADISDYERASDYLNALDRFYGGKQKSMADRLEVSEAWLSRYLDLARLPIEIVNAFNAVTDLRVQHGRDLKPLLRMSKMKAKLVARAEELERLQGLEPIKPEKVMIALMESVKDRRATKRQQAPHAEFQSSAGKAIMSVHKQGKSGWLFKFSDPREISEEELLDACQKAIETFRI